MEFSRQEYWSGLPFPSPGNLSNLGIERGSPPLQADALPSELTGRHGVIQAASTLREFFITKLSSFDNREIFNRPAVYRIPGFPHFLSTMIAGHLQIAMSFFLSELLLCSTIAAFTSISILPLTPVEDRDADCCP